MAALTQDRDTLVKAKFYVQSFKMGVAKVYAGSLVKVTNASGFASPASDTAATTVVGVAEEQIDNSAGANGDKEVKVASGIFKFAHSGLVQADVGQNVVVLDDQTVTNAATATNDIVAGKLMRLDSDGAWVKVGL